MRVSGWEHRFALLGRRLYQKYALDAVATSGAALSYYFVFSLFPFLLFVVALIAYLPLETPVQEFIARLRLVVPAPAMSLVEGQVRDLITHERPHLVTLGLLGSFWSASRGVDALRQALNLAHAVKESRPPWKREVACWAVTLSGAVLLVLAAGALVAGGRLGVTLGGKLGIGAGFASAMRWLRWPVLGLTFMTTTGLAYRFLPAVKVRLRSVAPGAAVSGFSWVLMTWLFGEYLAAFGKYHVTYGTLGGLMMLLTWLYLSGVTTLAGGELNAALARATPDRAP